MATIIKRKKNYSVVYYYENESGEKSRSGKVSLPTKMRTNER